MTFDLQYRHNATVIYERCIYPMHMYLHVYIYIYVYIYVLCHYILWNCFLWSNEIDVQVEFHNGSLKKRSVVCVLSLSELFKIEVLSSLFLDIPICLKGDTPNSHIGKEVHFPSILFGALLEATWLSPDKAMYWRWFSFSEGGICQFLGGYLC